MSDDLPKDGYRAPRTAGRAELREQGSKFLAIVEPVADESGAKARLVEHEKDYRRATHVCWALRLGGPAEEQYSDAGEPTGTAGEPMLMVLRGRGISDVLAVVIRWFGGTKLGKGGLARAYTDVTRMAIRDLSTVIRVPTATLQVEIPFESLGAIKWLKRLPEVEIMSQEFGESALLTLRVWESREEEFRAMATGLGVIIGENRD